MINIAICDDEEKILNYITEKIQQEFHSKNAVITVYKTSSPVELLDYLKDNTPEVLFLDIDMPVISGMDIAKKLLNEEYSTLLIFVTNQDSLVYQSFKYHPFGFIRKSCFDRELGEVVQNILDELSRRNNTFSFKTTDGIYRVKLSEILYFESEANYINIHAAENSYRFRGTLTALESELAGSGFIRTHKGFLVNQKHVFAIHTDDISMSDGSLIPISRNNKDVVKAKIMRYIQ